MAGHQDHRRGLRGQGGLGGVADQRFAGDLLYQLVAAHARGLAGGQQ